MGMRLRRSDGLHWLKAGWGRGGPWQLEDGTVAVSGDGAGLATSNVPAVVGSWSRRLAKPEGCVAHTP